MFKFVGTTVINTTKDSSGKPLFAALASSGKDASKFNTPDRFQIKRFGVFDKECIVNIFQTNPVEGKPSELTFKVPSFATLLEGEYRFSFRVVPMTAPIFEYQNYSTYPGRTFDLDFIVARPDEDTGKIADKIKAALNTYLRNSELDFTFTSLKGSDTITFKTKNANFKFENVILYKYNNVCGVNCNTTSGYQLIDRLDVPENFAEDTVTYTGKETFSGSSLVLNTMGFGTYDHLLRSVNLPTDENYGFYSRTADMRPIPGVKYTQFVIDYYKNRGVLGHAAVGENTESLTQFSIWVAESIVKDFTDTLDKLQIEKGPDKRWKEIKAEADYPKAADHVTGPTTKKQKTIKTHEEE